MQRFQDVVGHRDVIAHLQNAIAADQVSHAYIFGGEAGSGKKMLASLFARTLQCEKHGIEPCMECPSCKKALSQNHPDIIYIHHEKPNSIGIDELRAQLINDIGIRPYSSRYKIYIMDEAQKMTLQAQNALLKTIEEPPAYAVILLLADNPDALLPTVTSRCVILNLKPVADDLVRDYLMEHMHIPDYQAEVDAAFAQGNIGKAERIAQSAEYVEVMESALRLARSSYSMNLYKLVDQIRKLSAEKNNADDYLEILSMWFRDVLMFKATREVDTLVFKQEINAIRERASKSSYEGLDCIIEAIHTAQVRLAANVNFELTMELMFLAMKEN